MFTEQYSVDLSVYVKVDFRRQNIWRLKSTFTLKELMKNTMAVDP